MDELKQALEKEYCPPLDPALVLSIASDFVLTRKDELDSVRQALDQLKGTVEAEEATGFDPSGSSNSKDVLSDQQGSRFSSSDTASSPPSLTDGTSSLSAFHFEDSKDVYDKGIDAMSIDEKASLLKQMFTDLRPFDVEFTLKKQKADFGATVEILLNQKFLAEEADEDGLVHHAPRGVDGFAAASNAYGRKKPRRRKKAVAANTARLSLNPALTDGAASGVNRWQIAKEDVDFIASRTEIPETTVKSIYNSCGHSRHATIVAICSKKPEDLCSRSSDAEDPHVQTSIVDLRGEFPGLSVIQITRLVILTHPLFASARELAAVIATPLTEFIVPQYRSTRPDTHISTAGALALEDAEIGHSDTSSLPINTSFTTLRSNAFAAASAAYRKSRSNPLMGGAAAYYAEQGHIANAAMKRNRGIEANNRVAAQSNLSQSMCDLHGVTVADAERIARQYVQKWWETSKEYAREGSVVGAGVRGSFRIVVGRGAHSEAHRGKLGPAVAKILRAEGWRVEQDVGELLVKGKVRK